MTIKAVFFDMDGTLLTDRRTVSRSTIVAINTLKQQGIMVGVATGRDPRFVLKYMAALGLDVAITYNGQYIFSRESVLFSQALASSEVATLIAYAKKEKKELALGLATGMVGSGIMNFGMGRISYLLTRFIPKTWTGAVHFFFNRFVRLVRPQDKSDLLYWLQQPVYQMVLLETEQETRKIAPLFPDLDFTRSSSYATDIVTKGMSKLQGITKVCEMYQMTLNQVMVFGDASNDVEMLSGVGCSVAMGNASKKVKQLASYVTTSNNHDGIYKALRHFGLLGKEEEG